MTDVSFMLRTAHLEKLRKIIDDPEATDNDRFVAYNLLQNAAVAAKGELPSCQDTGTAIVMAKKGENVYTGIDDAQALSKRSEEHTSELQSRPHLVCRLLLEKKKK